MPRKVSSNLSWRINFKYSTSGRQWTIETLSSSPHPIIARKQQLPRSPLSAPSALSQPSNKAYHHLLYSLTPAHRCIMCSVWNHYFTLSIFGWVWPKFQLKLAAFIQSLIQLFNCSISILQGYSLVATRRQWPSSHRLLDEMHWDINVAKWTPNQPTSCRRIMKADHQRQQS